MVLAHSPQGEASGGFSPPWSVSRGLFALVPKVWANRSLRGSSVLFKAFMSCWSSQSFNVPILGGRDGGRCFLSFHEEKQSAGTNHFIASNFNQTGYS